LTVLPGCVGMALGGGAALGVAAAKEGGISGAAEDLKIKALINDKWFKYDLNTFSKLNITVNQGRVLLTGVVQNPDARVEAVKLAWQVGGVKQVINEIRVAESDGLPGYIRDEWITTRLRTAITFDRDVQSINYSIDTVQGTVYLMGVAQNRPELDRVIEIARTIPNVQQVVSYVKLAGEIIADDGSLRQAPPSNQPASGYMTQQEQSQQPMQPMLTQPDMQQPYTPPVYQQQPAYQQQPSYQQPAYQPTLRAPGDKIERQTLPP
jgi:osmotically-inducible protein OsmY